MNKPILTERIMASEALRAEYVQDVIHWLADHWSMDRALNEYDAKIPVFGIIRPASDKPMMPKVRMSINGPWAITQRPRITHGIGSTS